MPSNAGLFHGIAKNLHLAVLSLCLNRTAHTPNCQIFALLYMFSMTEVFLVACKTTIVDLGNKMALGYHSFKCLVLYVIHTPF